MKSITKNTFFGRRAILVALAVGTSWFFTAAASAQLTTEVQTALNTLNGTLGSKPVSLSSTSVSITTTELQTMIKTLATNNPGNAVADINSILAVINTATGNSDIKTGGATVATAAPVLLAGVNQAGWTGATLTTNFPAVAAAIANTANYTNSGLTESGAGTTVDSKVTATIATAITDYGSAGGGEGDILASVLTTYEPTHADLQGILVGTEIKAAMGATITSMAAIGHNIATNYTTISGSPSASGIFLENILNVATALTPQQGFLEGFTATETASQLATTAANIMANAPTTFVAASRENVFFALAASGTLSTLVATGTAEGANVQAVLAGVLSGYNYSDGVTNDGLKKVLANAVLTSAWGGYASNIAIAAAAATTGQTSDLAVLTKTLEANGQIGATGIASIVQAIATNVFPVAANLTATGGGTSNLDSLVAVAQGAIAGAPTMAQQIVTAVSAQALANLGNGASAGDEINFADALVTPLCTTANGLNVSDANRAAIATGLALAFDGVAGAPESLVAAAASTSLIPSVSTLKTVVNPVLVAFSSISGTEVGAIAAAVSKITIGGSVNTAQTSAFLITNAGTAGSSIPLIDDIVLGVATDSTVTTSATDTFVTNLATDLKASSLDIWNMAATLAVDSRFTAPQVASDFSAGVAPSLAATLSGTIVALNSTTQSEAAAIAYAAANSTVSAVGALQPAIDTNRQTIATAVLKALLPINGLTISGTNGAAVAISGSVATIIPDDAGKGTFALTMGKIITTSTAATISNLSNIALAVAQTVSPGDVAGLVYVANGASKDFATLADSSAATDIGSLVDNIAANFDGGTLGYQNQSVFTAAMVKDYSTALTPILTDVIGTVLADPNNAGNIPMVTGTFAQALYGVKSTDAAAVAHTFAQLDTAIATDAGPMTTQVLLALGTVNGATNAPAIAQALATGIPVLSSTEAIAIAEAAAGAASVTAANQNLVATDVVSSITSGTTNQQAALDPIAQYISSNLATVTDAPLSTNAAKLTSDQTTLATKLATTYSGTAGFNEVSIAYDVATSASGSSVVATIAAAVLNAPKVALTTSGVDAFTTSLVTDLTTSPVSLSLGTFNYGQAAILAGALAKDLSSVVGVSNSLAAALVQQEINLPANVGLAASIAGSFAGNMLVTSATQIAFTAAQTDTALGGVNTTISTDAGPITTHILTALGATLGASNAPTVAQAVAGGIGTGSLSASEAEAIADGAAGATGVTVANQGLVATNVISQLQSPYQQAALNVIAQYVSANIATVTDVGKTTLAADQATLATALAKKFGPGSAIDQASIAYDVSTSAASNAAIAGIAEAVLKAPATTITTTIVDAFASELVSDLSANGGLSVGTFSYTNAAAVAALLVTDNTAVVGLNNAISSTLVPLEIGLSGSSAASAAQISGTFATAIPTSAIAIVTAATQDSLYTGSPTGLTATQAGTIASTVGSVISTTITPGVTGTLAQIAASAAVLQPNQSFGNAIVNVAQVFATSKVPAADYSAISIALTGTFAGTYGTNRGDSVAPVVAAQFLSSLGSGSTLLTPFLKAMEQTNYVNAADILGTYLDLVDSGILGTGSTETAGEKALVTAVEAYINNSTVLSELVNLGGPFNSGMTPTQQTAELLSLLQAGVTAANSDLYINEGSLTGDETPVVPM